VNFLLKSTRPSEKQSEILPHAKSLPRLTKSIKTPDFPSRHLKNWANLGYLGLPIGAEYGGAGADYRSYVIACRRNLPGLRINRSQLCRSRFIGQQPHLPFLATKRRRKYLPKLASGEHIGCWALTEPGTGSDASAQKTTAKRVGDHYVLNGTKQFITNATDADTAIIMAMTDKSQGSKAFHPLLWKKGTPGFFVSKVEKKLGMRGSPTASLTFEDCKNTVENMLGAEGEGYKQALMTLGGGRLSIGALALGIAQSCV